MIRIGLTGSIGMGKSTALAMFERLGAVVWDADEAVRRLYATGGAAVPLIEAAFPGVVTDGAVDKAALAAVVLQNTEQLTALERIVHPLVADDRLSFMKQALEAGAAAAVLDIPLLFENGSEAMFDAVVVVSAPTAVQRARVLARRGMSEGKLAAILAQQLPDEQKREKADYVLSSDQPLEDMERDVRRLYEKILEKGSRQ